MNPFVIFNLLLTCLILNACCNTNPLRNKHTNLKIQTQGDVTPEFPNASTVSQAVMHAKIRVTLAHPEKMGAEATFEQLAPWLALTLPPPHSSIQDLEKLAGKKILALGKYPSDLQPEDNLQYQE